MDAVELYSRFEFLGASTTSVERMEQNRDTIADAAAHVDNNTKDCREKSLAITKLEEALFWANRAVCVNQGDQ